MQSYNIIEKARKLGIDVGDGTTNANNLRYIANQLNVEDLEELEETLDEMLLQQENTPPVIEEVNNDEDYIENEVDNELNRPQMQRSKWSKPNSNNSSTSEDSPLKNNDASNRIKRFRNKIMGINNESPKEPISDGLKESAKDVGKKTTKALAGVGKKVSQSVAGGITSAIKFAASNPVVLIIIGCLILFFIIIILYMNFFDGSSGKKHYGLSGYDYIEPKCTTITITDGEYAGVYDIEEYVAGVTFAEFGVFIRENRYEAAKAGAIAARSFVQSNIKEDCSVISSSAYQNYRTPTDAAIRIAEETRGLVLVENNSIKLTMYDAFCTSSPQEDPENYIICQQSQKIPRSWVDAQGGIKDSWKNGTMSGAHGNGMSAWGAAYLSEQGYNFKQILEFYYPESEIYSIYKSFQITNNWTQEITTWASSSIPTTILNQPLTKLLSKSEYEELNELIYDNVMDAGIGTRDAIVAAAVTPIKYLAENYNVVIPYTLGGGHYINIFSNYTGANIQKTTTTYYGVDPDWGTPINYSLNGGYYDKYGPDCSAWVPWVYHNAGISIGPRLAGSFQYLGTKHPINGDYIASPGDFLESSGHITVIVGVDEEAQKYYIAHASGGKNGTIISPVSFSDDGYYIVEMTDYINNNKMTSYETNYMEGVYDYR